MHVYTFNKYDLVVPARDHEPVNYSNSRSQRSAHRLR